MKAPSPPILRLRNATQTSLVLEWDPIDLATASLKSLSLYRNNSKAGSIPRPLETRSTKISGLAIHTEYTFHLVLRTTAGTYQSEKLTCRTHKMTDLSGITVTAGVLDPARKEALGAALDRIGGKLIDTVRIDTTHFVCSEGRGPQWEKAVATNIPVVVPEWVDACESEGTIVGVRGYYLDADPKARQLGVIHGSSHQRTTSTVSLSSTAAGRPSIQPQIVEPVPEQNEQPEQPEQAPEQLPEPPLTPFPGGESSSQPHVQEEDVRSEDEADTASPLPPKSEDDVDDNKPNGNSSPNQNGEAEAEHESKSKEGTLPHNRPDEESEQPSDASSKSKGKDGESDFNEVPL